MTALRLYSLHAHQNKERAYAEALSAAGWFQARRAGVSGVRFHLTDADWERELPGDVPVFLYPHAARPMVQYDCPNLEPRRVRCMFTQAEGGRELMKMIGYPYPVEVTGWTLCPIRPFAAVPRVRSVLFAPIHPNGNGYLNEVDKDLNRRAYGRVSAWCRESGARLTVRYIGDLRDNGLAEAYALAEPHVVWTLGKKNGSILQMEGADLIVGHQTYAWMACALGKPVLMFGEDVAPRSGNSDVGFCYAEHWEEYRDYLAYPLDVLNESRSVNEWVELAACSEMEQVKEWKRCFIGKPFDGVAFVKKLEGYL